jgi:hypothetical protein
MMKEYDNVEDIIDLSILMMNVFDLIENVYDDHQLYNKLVEL